MSSTATQRLRLDKQATGDNPNAWGVRLNAALDLIDESQGGLTLPVTANLILTSNNFASDQARRMALRFTGVGGFNVTIPQVDKAYFIVNACTNPVTVKTALDPGIAVRAGAFRWIYCDGSAVYGDVTIEAGEAADIARTAATQAAASAAAAALYDPNNFYTKTVSDTRYAPLAPYASQDDFRTVAIQLAKLKGSTVGMAGGVVDDFRDQTGYDTTNSTGAFYDVALNTVANGGSETTQSLPAMTSGSAPTGHVATASSTAASFSAYFAFDQTTSFWSSSGLPAWVQRKVPTAITVAAYRLRARSDSNPGASAKTFRLRGSNDGSAFTTLDSQVATGWSLNEIRSYQVAQANLAPYLYFRLEIDDNNSDGGNVVLAELELLQAFGPNILDLQSVLFSAQAVPAKGSIFVLAKALSGSVAANTNFLAKLSRNGGTNYTTATLTSTGTLSSGYTVYEANGFDISGQPSGSSMKWRLQTVGTTLAVQVDAVVAQWG